MGIDWRMGAEWFETCLLDYDPCSNYGNWTYGSGKCLETCVEFSNENHNPYSLFQELGMILGKIVISAYRNK